MREDLSITDTMIETAERYMAVSIGYEPRLAAIRLLEAVRMDDPLYLDTQP